MKNNSFFEKFLKIIFSFPVPITILVAIFLFIAPEKEFKPIAVIIGCCLMAVTPFLRKFLKRNRLDENNETIKQNSIKYKHHEDIKSCIDVMNKIKNFIDNNPKKKELKNIYPQLQHEMDYINNISDRLDLIIETLNDPYWDIGKIDLKIKDEESKEIKDENRLNKLSEMREHIIKLKNKKEKLENHINSTALSFQTIFTKITLIDNYDRNSFDEIENEIIKILDHQIKVDEYEEKLEKELY